MLYDILQKALPSMPAELQAEASAALTEYEQSQEARNVLNLTPTEEKIYLCLLENKGAYVSYDAIMGKTGIKTRESLWVHRNRLNRKLKKIGKYVGTLIQRGYMLTNATSNDENNQ